MDGHIVKEMLREGSPVQYLVDQVVVKLAPKYSRDKKAQELVLGLLPAGSRAETPFNRTGICVFNLPPETDSAEVAEKLQQHEQVEFAQPSIVHEGSPSQ